MANDPVIQQWLEYFARTNPGTDINKNIAYWTAAAEAAARDRGSPTNLDLPQDQATVYNEQSTAYDELRNTFKTYGLEELVDEINSYAIKGYSSSQASLALKQSEAYKKRFAGNEMLRKAGLAVLNEEDYLNTESSISAVMRLAGMPDTFSSRDNIARLIGGNVSAQEVQRRINYATDFVNNTPETVRNEYLKRYGVTTADLAAAFLDPTLAEPVINTRIRNATIGGAATAVGVQPTLAEQIGQAQPGLSYGQAEQDFRKAAELGKRGERLGTIYGDQYGIQEAQQQVFGLAGGAEAEQTAKRLASKERAAFTGGSGIRSGSLAQERGGI